MAFQFKETARRYLRGAKRRIMGPAPGSSASGRKAKAKAKRPVANNPGIIFQQLLFENGAYEKVETDLRDRLKHEPLDAASMILLAECRLRQNSPEEAIDLLEEAEAVAGYKMEARRLRVDTLAAAGRGDEARDLMLATIDYDPLIWRLCWDYADLVEEPAHHAALVQRWQRLLAGTAMVSPAIERAVAKSATLGDDFPMSYGIYRRLVAGQLHEVTKGWKLLPSKPILKIEKEKANDLEGGRGEDCLKDLKGALAVGEVPFFLMAGTVLGYVRDGRLLPGDKDVDIGIFGTDYDRTRIEDLLRLSGRFQIKRVDNHADRIRAVHRNGVWVDVFPHFAEGGRLWHAGMVARWWHPAFELAAFDVDGTEFMIPADPEAYLEWNYGPGWRLPDPLFDVYEDAPNVEVTRHDFLRYSRWRKLFESLAVNDWPKVLHLLDRSPDIAAENPWLSRLEIVARQQTRLQGIPDAS